MSFIPYTPIHFQCQRQGCGKPATRQWMPDPTVGGTFPTYFCDDHGWAEQGLSESPPYVADESVIAAMDDRDFR